MSAACRSTIASGIAYREVTLRAALNPDARRHSTRPELSSPTLIIRSFKSGNKGQNNHYGREATSPCFTALFQALIYLFQILLTLTGRYRRGQVRKQCH